MRRCLGCGPCRGFLRPELGLVDGRLNFFRVQFADKQLLGHAAGRWDGQAAEHGLDAAVGQHGVGDVLIQLPKPLVAEDGEQAEFSTWSSMLAMSRLTKFWNSSR